MAAKAKPVPDSEIILEEISQDRKIVAVEYSNGSFHVEDRKVEAGKKCNYIPVWNNGNFFESPYLHWEYAFAGKSKGQRADRVRNNGLKSVRQEKRLAYPALFTSDEIIEMGFDQEQFLSKLKKSFTSETILLKYAIRTYVNADYDINCVLYADGCLNDYFDLEQIIDAYAANGINLQHFQSELEQYWQKPISEMADEHLLPRNMNSAIDEDDSSYKDLFSFYPMWQGNGIIKIAAGLLMGYPVESTIKAITKSE